MSSVMLTAVTSNCEKNSQGQAAVVPSSSIRTVQNSSSIRSIEAWQRYM